MNDALAVRGVEASRHLQRHVDRLVRGQRPTSVEPLPRACGPARIRDTMNSWPEISSRACTAATFGCTSAAAARASSRSRSRRLPSAVSCG